MERKRLRDKLLENFGNSPIEPTHTEKSILSVIVLIILIVATLSMLEILDLNYAGIIIAIGYVAIFFLAIFCISLYYIKTIYQSLKKP